MSLHRKKIRAALVTKLTSHTDAGNRVYASRVKPIWNDTYPLILIQTNNESIETFNQAPKEYKRTLQIEIQIMAEAVTTGAIDDILDTVGAQVEARLYEEGTQLFDEDDNELCEEVALRGAEMVIDKEGDRLYGVLSLNYEVVYYTEPICDASELEWLDTVHVDYDLEETPSGVGPEDDLTDLSGL